MKKSIKLLVALIASMTLATFSPLYFSNKNIDVAFALIASMVFFVLVILIYYITSSNLNRVWLNNSNKLEEVKINHSYKVTFYVIFIVSQILTGLIICLVLNKLEVEFVIGKFLLSIGIIVLLSLVLLFLLNLDIKSITITCAIISALIFLIAIPIGLTSSSSETISFLFFSDLMLYLCFAYRSSERDDKDISQTCASLGLIHFVIVFIIGLIFLSEGDGIGEVFGEVMGDAISPKHKKRK